MSDAPVAPTAVQEQAIQSDKGRDLGDAAASLVAWLSTKLEGASDLRVHDLSYPVGAGASNETILFDAAWTQGGAAKQASWVLRVHPSGHQLFLHPDFRMQYDLLHVLGTKDLVKVPEVLWYEDDPSWFGQPCFLMGRMRGRVPVSQPVYNRVGWLTEATPAQRRTVWHTAFAEMMRIHQVPVDLVGFVGKPEYGGDGLDQQLALWERSIPWCTGGNPPELLLQLADWLRANKPADHVDGLAWGDARMGNMMFGDDYRLVGVMDWEQASLAGSLRDLGWWTFFDDAHSVGQGVARLDGLGTRAETLELYTELMGRMPTNLQWYEVFAGYTVIQLSLRGGTLAGAPGGGDIAKNMFLGLVLDRLGWPAPKASS